MGSPSDGGDQSRWRFRKSKASADYEAFLERQSARLAREAEGEREPARPSKRSEDDRLTQTRLAEDQRKAREAEVKQQASNARDFEERYLPLEPDEDDVYEDEYEYYYEEIPRRRGLSVGSWVTIAVLVLVLGGGTWWLHDFLTQSTAGTLGRGITTEVVIPEQQGVAEVGTILADAGLVGNSFTFSNEARADGRANQIQPGTYKLAGGMTVSEILDVITAKPEGKEVKTWALTIPEGLSAGQIFHRMGQTPGSPYTAEQYQAAAANVKLPEWVPTDLPADAQRLEGFIWPDTYQIYTEDTAEEVLQHFVDESVKQVESAGAAPGLDLYKTLIIASLVEKETAVDAERPVVSGVIRNRLNKPMRLQIDATVVYAIARATGNRPTRLTNADYEFSSAWSTYTNDGLPPTPIANVGKASLQAAAAPADTPFFYYVVNDLNAGTHAFSTSFEEHQQNVANLRRLMNEREKAAPPAPTEAPAQQ
ncbi:endolytic transglycosylase MltG [Stomatohabitans albus]|uniref:endolytic transglycosylase MltG n=1 Tax=Stomatohabitans albus TaxID=3110766 RepID=UPI00300C28A7